MSTSFGPKPLLALLLSILVVQGAYGALDAEEIDALNHLLFAFPDLAHVPSVFASAGPSWVPGFTGLCDVDDQWTYHGLMCWGGHIAVMALYVYSSFLCFHTLLFTANDLSTLQLTFLPGNMPALMHGVSPK